MTVCASCTREIPVGSEVVVRGQGRNVSNITLCSSCADRLEQSYQAETEEVNFFGALLLGLAAAAVGSAAWYAAVTLSKYQIGLLAIAVGWLVAQGVLIGSGRKRGLPLQLLSAAITLAVMLVSEYAIARYLVIQQLVAEGSDFIFPLLLPPSDLVEFMLAWIKAEPMTLFFWGLAVFEAFVLPARRSLRRLG